MSRINPALFGGRLTAWTSNCELNADVMEAFNLQTESDYRMFLQQHPDVVAGYLKTPRYVTVLPYYNVTPCVRSQNPPLIKK